MNNKFGTGIWNSVKRNATDPLIMGGAAVGAFIGIHNASTVKSERNNELQLATIGIGVGGLSGKFLKHLGEQPEGLPIFGRGAV